MKFNQSAKQELISMDEAAPNIVPVPKSMPDAPIGQPTWLRRLFMGKRAQTSEEDAVIYNRIHKAKQQTITSQVDTLRLELQARQELATLALSAEVAEAHLRDHQHTQQIPHEHRLALTQRRSSSSDVADTLAPFISDEQIEALVLRAVTEFGSQSPAEAARARAEWRRELSQEYPPLVVDEIDHCLEDMLRTARNGR